MRQVVLDTETTGLHADARIVEIGCVELIERKLTGRRYHIYINPECAIPVEASNIHGITNEWLEQQNAPVFSQIVDEFCQFIDGAEIVAHNASFDVARMDYEFKRLNLPTTTTFCTVLDTYRLAKQMYGSSRHSLDALCKRFGIDNSHRELHGALLDAELLAEVYLAMTGGQTDLVLTMDSEDNTGNFELNLAGFSIDATQLGVVRSTENELAAHDEFLNIVDKKCGQALWRMTTQPE